MLTAVALPETTPVPGTQMTWVDELPAELPGSIHFGAYLQTRPGDALFTYPDIGRFRVRNGRQIEIQIAPGATPEMAAAAARIAPFAALIHQRGDFPLHSSAVVRPGDGKVLLIAGNSGAGKSTTAAAFARNGWKVMNDDVSRLSIEDGKVLVWPGYTALKLLGESCRLLQIDSTGLSHTGEVKGKFYWPTEYAEGPRLPSAIVRLTRGNREDKAPRRLRGSAAMQMLLEQTYRPKLVRALGLRETHFAQVLQVAARIPCFEFSPDYRLGPADVGARMQSVLE